MTGSKSSTAQREAHKKWLAIKEKVCWINPHHPFFYSLADPFSFSLPLFFLFLSFIRSLALMAPQGPAYEIRFCKDNVRLT